MGHDSGRPRKSADGNLRDVNFKLRLSSGEKSRLLTLSKTVGLSMSDYLLRRSVYDDQPVVIVDSTPLIALARELAYQGNNLNQAAHALTAALAAPHSPQFESYLQEGARSVIAQEEARLALYRKLDDATCAVMASRHTIRSL